MSTTVQDARFQTIRYAQCWEDADVLLAALDIQPGNTCLSIGSAGDNTLAMLVKNPARVIVVDCNPAQMACLELRIAAYRTLEHAELLELIGSRPSTRRLELYRRCRGELPPATCRFWDARLPLVEAGIGAAGKFERYFALFRSRVLPFIHHHTTVAALLQPRSASERELFYREVWDSLPWRLMYRAFFSRTLLGRLGRDPSFFRYVEGSVADRLLARTRFAVTTLDPTTNPYLQWILTGRHLQALPYALRPEHFATIRANLDCLELHCCSLEDALEAVPEDSVDSFNLSDVFEYVSLEAYHHLLGRLVQTGKHGARLAYWNMLAPRSRPACMAAQLRPLESLAQHLFEIDQAFFYSRFVLEEVRK